MKKRYLRLVRRTFRTLRHRRLRHRKWWQALTRPLFARHLWMPCRDTVATGLAVGMFFSMIPFIPQALCSSIICMWIRGNIPFAVAACFISNFITTGPIMFAQVKLGNWLIDHIGLPLPQVLLKAETTLTGIGRVGICGFTLGIIVSSTLLALLSYPIVYVFSLFMPHHLPVIKRKPAAPRATPSAQTGGQ